MCALPCVRLLAATIIVATLAGTSGAQTGGLRQEFDKQFLAELQHIAQDSRSVVGIKVIDLTDGTDFGVHDGLVFPQASAIKVPVLIELFKQADKTPALLKERRSVDSTNRSGGSGIIGRFADSSSTLSLEDLAVLMVVLSDNTATNILVDAVGRDNINKTLAAMALPATFVGWGANRTDTNARSENVSSPADAAAIMRRIAKCDLPMSESSCKRLREILEMPKDDPVRNGVIPANVKVAFKPGYTNNVRTAWAIVDLPGRPYVLTVMTTFNASGIPMDGDGAEIVHAVSKAVYEHFIRLPRTRVEGSRGGR
jgi:beta-lactamase class A